MMDKVLADMLKRVIPQEVLAQLTLENFNAWGAQAKAFMQDHTERLSRIEAGLAEIREYIENERNNRGKHTRKPNASASLNGGSAD